MSKQKIDKLARIAEEQRAANGLPTFSFSKLYAAMSPSQKKQFWDYVNHNGKDGNKMCMNLTMKE